MSKKVTVRALALLAGGALCFTAIPLSACGGGGSDSIVVMSEEFSGLFNPFYATSGADIDVVNLTQLNMLTTDSNGDIVAGKDQATAVLDYEVDSSGADTVYTFVLKNGLKFSDGKPLTMNDVMFNLYEYLDPVYTGSSTLYSVKIKGLTAYRTQSDYSGDNGQAESALSTRAYGYAENRRAELSDLYKRAGADPLNPSSEDYFAEPDDVKKAIESYNITNAYKTAVNNGKSSPEEYKEQLLKDYELVLKNFEEELNDDFAAAKEAFDLTTAPYKGHKELESDVFKFLLYEGIIEPEYDTSGGKPDPSIIVGFNKVPDLTDMTTKEKAVAFAFNRMISEKFLVVISGSVTAANIMTKFSSDAKQWILIGDGGTLAYPRVEGIVSLGHKVNDSYVLGSAASVTIHHEDGTTKDYKIAKEHNDDGTPRNAHGTPTNVNDSDEYDILRVTLDGKDPKALYNFAFAVAPAHYYTEDAEHPNGRTIDIENNDFGVKYSDADFQSNVIQSRRNASLPMGAGPYKASDSDNSDTPSGLTFYNNNFVFYKSNDHFLFEVKTKKFRYQYVSSTNAIDKLRSKEIDFVTPAFTKENSETLKKMEKNGFESLYAWQLGYGYVGINAGLVPNINVRKAIMSAMKADLATEFYLRGTCEVIDWPMSNRSWAYPTENGKIGGPSLPNGKDYMQWSDPGVTETEKMTNTLAKIKKYTDAALSSGATAADFKLKFTIAGASITQHPIYAVFRQAADLLKLANEKYGYSWNVEVVADSRALTKLATGSLAVWAAAWGSTIDPDMYQVYHKNSTASSVYSWGYRQILGPSGETNYPEEYGIITGNGKLSDLIDDARSIEDKTERANLYKQAMGYVLDLAVEMPIYQRQNLYAYNAKKIGGIEKNVNPFTSPLERVWELEIL